MWSGNQGLRTTLATVTVTELLALEKKPDLRLFEAPAQGDRVEQSSGPERVVANLEVIHLGVSLTRGYACERRRAGEMRAWAAAESTNGAGDATYPCMGV